jgi:outer membrane protein OmpA-like peptidoglycan-associated protein
MRSLWYAGGAAALLAAAASPLAAQRTGSVEVGAFAQASYFDRTLGFDQGSGGGGARVGFFLLRALSLEAEGAFIPTDRGVGEDVEYFPLRGNLVLNVPAGEHTALLLGGGYVHNEYRNEVRGSDDGATGHVGLRLGLPGLPSVRLATYVDYIPSPLNGAGENWNWGIQAGLSLLLGGGRGATRAAEEPEPDSLALAAQRDSLARATQADSLARARADSARALAVRDSLAKAQRDSVARVEEQLKARAQALRDSLQLAAREDSLRTVALRDSLRLTRDRARRAAIRDSLERVALRDSLRAMVAARETRVTLRGVNFEINKAVLLPVSQEILLDVARSLVANPDVTVEVAGHTDNTGPRELNERLSRERAEAVKAYLIENGVAAERMTTQGYAWDQPVASNKTASGRAQNRRTELRRTD